MPVQKVGFAEGEAPESATGIVRVFADSADHHIKAKLPDDSVIDMCAAGDPPPATAVWGGITGTLANQTDLQGALDGKANVSHAHFEYEPANANIQAHVTAPHAPSNAQANADITKGEIEAKLTGVIASHSHAGGSDGEVTVVATQDTANATVNLANATGLTFSALANSTYIIEAYLVWDVNVSTVGIKVSATASGSPTIIAGRFASDAANGTPDSSSYNANDVVVTTSASPFTTNNFGYMSGILKTAGSASTWQLRFAAETTGTITVKAGSTIRYRKVA